MTHFIFLVLRKSTNIIECICQIRVNLVKCVREMAYGNDVFYFIVDKGIGLIFF